MFKFMSRILTRLALSEDMRKFVKHGYLTFEDGEVVLTNKGQRVLLGILFGANKEAMLTVITDYEKEQAEKGKCA